MIRFILMTVISIFLLSVVRMIAGAVSKGFSEMMNGSTGSPDSNAQRPPQPGPAPGGELRRDPVCGTYIPAATAVTKTVRGEVLCFCSAACRDKYSAA